MSKHPFFSQAFVLLILISPLFSAAQSDNYAEWYDQNPSASIIKDPDQAFSEQYNLRTWRTIKENPGLLENPQVFSKIATDELQLRITMMSNENFRKKFDDAIKANPNNIATLNNNPETKKLWLEQVSIKDEGGELKSYDGSILCTSGSKGTCFAAASVPGSKILPSGELVLTENGFFENARVSGGHLSVMEGGSYVLKEGDISVPLLSKIDVTVIGGSLYFTRTGSADSGERKLESLDGSPFTFQRTKNEILISGYVLESGKSKDDFNPIASYEGKFSIDYNEIAFLGKGTYTRIGDKLFYLTCDGLCTQGGNMQLLPQGLILKKDEQKFSAERISQKDKIVGTNTQLAQDSSKPKELGDTQICSVGCLVVGGIIFSPLSVLNLIAEGILKTIEFITPDAKSTPSLNNKENELIAQNK